MKIRYIIFLLLALNIAWVVIGAVRDYRKTDNSNDDARIDMNLNMATRNIQASIINVVLAILVLVCAKVLHLPI